MVEVVGLEGRVNDSVITWGWGFPVNAFNGINVMPYSNEVRDDCPRFIASREAILIDELYLHKTVAGDISSSHMPTLQVYHLQTPSTVR